MVAKSPTHSPPSSLWFTAAALFLQGLRAAHFKYPEQGYSPLPLSANIHADEILISQKVCFPAATYWSAFAGYEIVHLTNPTLKCICQLPGRTAFKTSLHPHLL